jgi:hypothetical protein
MHRDSFNHETRKTSCYQLMIEYIFCFYTALFAALSLLHLIVKKKLQSNKAVRVVLTQCIYSFHQNALTYVYQGHHTGRYRKSHLSGFLIYKRNKAWVIKAESEGFEPSIPFRSIHTFSRCIGTPSTTCNSKLPAIN